LRRVANAACSHPTTKCSPGRQRLRTYCKKHLCNCGMQSHFDKNSSISCRMISALSLSASIAATENLLCSDTGRSTVNRLVGSFPDGTEGGFLSFNSGGAKSRSFSLPSVLEVLLLSP